MLSVVLVEIFKRGASSIDAAVDAWADIPAVKGRSGVVQLSWWNRDAEPAVEAIEVSKPNGTFEFRAVAVDDDGQSAASDAGLEDRIEGLLRDNPRTLKQVVADIQAGDDLAKRRRARGRR